MKQLLLEAHLFRYPHVTMATQPHGLKNRTGLASVEKPHAVILDLRDQLRGEGGSTVYLNPRICSAFYFMLSHLGL